MKRVGLGLLVVGLLSAELRASATWIVDAGGGGDFTSLQDAIDAATDGDVILVRPGSYGDVDLSKHLAIRATSDPFEIANVVIHDLGPGVGASLSRFVTTGNNSSRHAFAVTDCEAPVLIEDAALDFHNETLESGEHLFLVRDCADVSIVEAVASDLARSIDPRPAFHFERSRIRCADVMAKSADAAPDDLDMISADAVPAMEAVGCELVLTRARLRGGNGANGFSGPSGGADGTNGGDGLLAVDCVVTILGTEADEIRGGDGGDFVPFTGLDAGDGGDGIRLEGSSSMLISRQVAIGGQGGFGVGSSAGTDGADISGTNWERVDFLPHLALSPDLAIGATATAFVDAVEPGALLLMLADRTGFAPPPGRAVGAPLSLVAGLFFEVIPLGRTDGAGDGSYAGDVPDESALVGLALHLQAFELADSGAVWLGNAIDRVIRP